jgi:hypothetical protein
MYRVDKDNNRHTSAMKSTTLSLLAITVAPAATFLLGLMHLSMEASFALATSIAIAAYAIDSFALTSVRGRS